MKKLLDTRILSIIAFLCLPSILIAQETSNADLVAGLQAGGKIIVMRHASSPRELPDTDSATEGNTNLERQLDAAGKEDARLFGEALRRLDIVIGETISSPAFRARETVLNAGLENLETDAHLSNEGMRESSAEKGQWLRNQVADRPVTGNRLLITHSPNIGAAFPDVGRTREGEALVFDPQVSSTVPVGRVAIGEWAGL